MLSHVPGVLTSDQLTEVQSSLSKARWIDGKLSAGVDTAAVKSNAEIGKGDPVSRSLAELIVRSLINSPRFVSLALPMRIVPPVFSRYTEGQSYGPHADSAVAQCTQNGQPVYIRTDLAATLFLSDPADYEGGELMIEHAFGSSKVKLPAGDMVLYPSSSLHQVSPVTRGTRHVAIFWVQSIVRNHDQRSYLESLDTAITETRKLAPNSPTTMRLITLYHNLLRTWAET